MCYTVLRAHTNTRRERPGFNTMIWHFPPTPKQLGATACVSLAGAALIAVGAHLSYANIAPQQARAQARKEFVLEYLRKKFGD